MSTRLLLGTYTDVVHEVLFTPPTATSGPRLEPLRELALGFGASWIVQHPSIADVFYVCLEADDLGGKKDNVEGHVAAYRIDDAGATLLSDVSAGENPCHVEVVQGGRALAAANYTGGSALLIPLKADGSFDVAGCAPPNYIKYPTLPGSKRSMGHECIDLPALDEVLVVDCGNDCLWRMGLVGTGADLTWETKGRVDVLKGHAPRQAVVSPDGRHLYSLYARSCLVTHHVLAPDGGAELVSTHSVLPAPHTVDLANWHPPYILAAALTLHEPSSTLTATLRCITGEKVDSVGFLKVQPDGTLAPPTILRPKRGREYRGVGIVGNCLLVAGQEDGWLTCFEWDTETDVWAERDWAGEQPRFDKVVDIEPML